MKAVRLYYVDVHRPLTSIGVDAHVFGSEFFNSDKQEADSFPASTENCLATIKQRF